MKSLRLLFILLTSLVISTALLTPVNAQPQECPVIIETALQTVNKICDVTGRNQACYGNNSAEAQPQPGASNFTFAEVGDVVNVTDVQTVRVNGLDEANGEWGVVLMRLQANIPDTLPGQNVTFLLLGDTEVRNAVPSVNEDGLQPMQAFYLNTGIRGATCNEAPQNGLLVQTPEGVGEISLTINEVNVMLGSTVFFSTQTGKEMTVTTIEGAAFVTAVEELDAVVPGTQLSIPLLEDGDIIRAAEPAGLLEAFEDELLQSIPFDLLEREIEIPLALTDDEILQFETLFELGESLCTEDRDVMCNDFDFLSDFVDCAVEDAELSLCEQVAALEEDVDLLLDELLLLDEDGNLTFDEIEFYLEEGGFERFFDEFDFEAFFSENGFDIDAFEEDVENFEADLDDLQGEFDDFADEFDDLFGQGDEEDYGDYGGDYGDYGGDYGDYGE